MSQEQSATLSLSVPIGPSTTNEEIIPVGLGDIRIVEAEHQVSDNLQNLGRAKSAEKSTIPGLVPTAAIFENAPLKADKAEAIASSRSPPQVLPGKSASIASAQSLGQVAFEPTGDNPEPQEPQPEGAEYEDMEPPEPAPTDSDEELWDELDDFLFGERPNKTLTADQSFREIAPGPSTTPSAGTATEPAPGPSTEQLSPPLAVSTSAAAMEEGAESSANASLPVAGLPSPAAIETAIGSQTDASLTAAVNALALSVSTETSSSLAPSTSNSAQSPPSLNQLQSTLAPASSSLIASGIVDAYSSTHMAYLSSSAGAANSLLSSTSATTATEPGVSSPRNVGWSSLPPEVREEVYKELLLVNMRQEKRDLSCHHLHLDILRVNRETYKEASGILYLRNTWVQINMNPEVGQYIGSRINKLRYWKEGSPIELRSVEFSGVAALNIVVDNKEKKNLPRHTYIISSFAMPQICRALTMLPMRTEEMPPLEMKLDLATAPKGVMWDQKGLLDCFVETLGLEALKYTKHVAMLAECRGKDGLAQLRAIALPLKDPALVMERASNYLDRGRQKVRARQIREALTIFREGADYNCWVFWNNPYDMSSSAMADSGIGTQLEENWWDFIEEEVSGCMQLGDITLGGDTPLSLFRRSGGSRTDNWAELFYTLGLIDEARGAENAAARSFLNALESTPGHEATNKAIDQLRERVRDKTGIEHVIVRHNIDNVLEPFRHRTPGQAPLGKEEARSIVEQFVDYTDDLHVSTTLSSIILPCLISEKLTERAGNNCYLNFGMRIAAKSIWGLQHV